MAKRRRKNKGRKYGIRVWKGENYVKQKNVVKLRT